MSYNFVPQMTAREKPVPAGLRTGICISNAKALGKHPLLNSRRTRSQKSVILHLTNFTSCPMQRIPPDFQEIPPLIVCRQPASTP